MITMTKKYNIILKLFIPLSYFPLILFAVPSFIHYLYVSYLLHLGQNDIINNFFYGCLLFLFAFIYFSRILLLFPSIGKNVLIHCVVFIDLITDLIVCFYFIFFRNLQYDRIDYLYFAILFVYCLLFVVQAFLKTKNVKFIFVTCMVTSYVVFYFTSKRFDGLESHGCWFANYIMRDLLTLLLLMLRKKEIKKQQEADRVRFSVIPDGYAPECEVIPPCRLNFDTQTTANINRLTRLPTHRRGCNVHLRSYIFGGILSNTERK